MRAYDEFLVLTNTFLNDGLGATIFCESIDQLWFDKEEELWENPKECDLVDDVMMLCDKYDECDEIVKHDNYCINEETLRIELKKLLDKQQALK